ncbi:DoxX family membrane protein [Streptomyces marincola]|uniref:DoxX family membrane protein n=1 Tax=Streptomyces marincola TaxID=2878388 RepID=UPI001CF2BB7A|nr:DoxX family membrane protein [Streptomyces marincola]UCM91584.1 DoxX family membrane protein [Streptomyces marincola]
MTTPHSSLADPVPGAAHRRPASVPVSAPTGGAKALAVLRIAIGAVFLWTFLDKSFGLGYPTASESSWINGGSPAAGYLGSVSGGPMRSTYNDWAGQVWVDWMYMAGMLGLGIALVAGIGLRVTAVAGSVMMLFLWLGEFPPARHLSDGTPSGSSNPLVDHHVVYAAVMVVLAFASAGRVWGLGRLWERTAIVRGNPWLR